METESGEHSPVFRVHADWIFYGSLVFAGLFGVGWLFISIRSENAVRMANLVVQSRVSEAKSLADSGKYDDALRLTEEAARTRRATNTNAAVELHQQIATQRDFAIASTKLSLARSFVAEGKFSEASATLDEYVTMPAQSEKEYAEQLLTACRYLSKSADTAQFLSELVDADFEAVANGRLPARFSRLTDNSGVTVVKHFQSNLEAAKARRQRVKEFRDWIHSRTFESSETRRIFDGYLAALMRTLDEESTTPAHRREYNETRKILNREGYMAFAIHFAAILEEVYTVDNFSTNRESEVSRRLAEQKNEIVKSIIDAVAASIPSR